MGTEAEITDCVVHRPPVLLDDEHLSGNTVQSVDAFVNPVLTKKPVSFLLTGTHLLELRAASAAGGFNEREEDSSSDRRRFGG